MNTQRLLSFLSSTLQSLNLSATLFAATDDSKNGLPELLLQQAADIRNEGGSKTLYEAWQKVQQSSSKNSNLLEDAFNALDDEHELDEDLRQRFGEGNEDDDWTTLTFTYLLSLLLGR